MQNLTVVEWQLSIFYCIKYVNSGRGRATPKTIVHQYSVFSSLQQLDVVAVVGSIWQYVAVHGRSWQQLALIGISWHLFALFGSILQ